MAETMNLPDNLLLEIQTAVDVGNKRKINALMGCKDQTNLRASFYSSLEPSTDQCADFIQLLARSLRYPSMKQRLSIEYLLRALLMVSPIYETPFEAAHKFVLSVPLLALSTASPCISAVEQFLREIRIFWQVKLNPQSVKQDDSKAWLEKLAQATVPMLYNNDTKLAESMQSENDRNALLKIIQGLFQALLALSRSLDDRCFESVLEKAVFEYIRPANTVHLLRLVLESIEFLRENDIERIRLSLMEDLSQHRVSPNEIPAIVGLSMSLIGACIEEYNDEASKENMMAEWKGVVYCSLSLVVMDETLYTAAEKQIQQALNRMGLRTLQFWCQGLKRPFSTTLVVRHWIKFHVASLSVRALHSTGTLLGQVALQRSTETSTHENHTMIACCDAVVSTCCPFGANDEIIERALGLNGNVNILQALDGVSYSPKGSFSDQEGFEIKVLSDIGRLLYSSIHLEQTPSQRSQSMAAPRAFRLIEVAKHILEVERHELCARSMLFSFVAMTIVYLECPLCRSSVVEKLKDHLYARTATSNQDSNLCCISSAAVNTIISSVLNCDEKGMTDHEKFAKLDPMCNLVLDSPPGHAFVYLLGLELSSIPRVRELILNRSKGLLYTSVCRGDEESSHQKESTQGGLLGLLELVRRSIWSHAELEAWEHFSNALVFDVPSLSLSNRSWLYAQLEDSIENEEISKNASLHLLRAVITRASFFFDVATEHDATRFVPERTFVLWPDPNSPHQLKARQLEDVLGLNRLILSLLYYISRLLGDNSDMMLHFARGRAVLLHSVLSDSQVALTTGAKATKKIIEELFPKQNSEDDLKRCLSIMTSQFAAVLECLVACSRNPKKSGKRVKKLSIPSPVLLMGEMLSREVSQLESYLTEGVGDFTLPVWLGDEGLPSWMCKGNLLVEQRIMIPLKASLFDFAIDLLFTPTLPLKELQNATFLSRQVVLAAGQLVKTKKFFSIVGCQDSLLAPETVNSTAAQFFAASSVVIQSVMKQHCTLEEANELIAPILQYCQCVSQVSREALAIATPEVLSSIWSLYQVIGGERAAVRFIAFLEKRVSLESQPPVEHDNSFVCLSSIRTVQDVDDSMQKIRLTVVGALNSFLLTLSSRNKDQEEASSFANIATKGLHVQTAGVPAESLVNILSALAIDLRTGLDGKSGGITRELYVAFMVAIEECAISLYTLRDVTCFSPTITCLTEVSEILADVLSTYFLNDAVLFRTTFLIAAAALPSMCREIARTAFVHVCQDGFADLAGIFDVDKVLLSGTLSESMDILSRWSTLRDPNSMPWADLAGSFHLESPDDNDVQEKNLSSEETMDAELEVPRIVHVPMQSDGSGETTSFSSLKIRFKTREMWSWALSCSLLALDEKWQESVRVLANNNLRDSGVRLEMSDCCFDFYQARKKELLFSLRSAGKFFASTMMETQSRHAVPHLILEMISMNLPSAPRLRFCCLLLTIAKALHCAIDTVQSKLQSEYKSALQTANHVGFIEAVCCLSAWLYADFQEPEITVGICRWQNILKRKLPRGSSSYGSNVTSDLISRLDDLVSLVGLLQTKLQKLGSLIRETKATISAFDILFEGGLPTMASLITRRLSLLEKEVPGDKRTNLLPDFPESSDDTQRKRKRKRQGHKPKRQKLPVARSRNRVVDLFFHLDEGTGESPKRKGQDAFVDLEDFLVEG
eukprot:scaffold880_cov132-Cylindrotheca_fusiformis.AAC.4